MRRRIAKLYWKLPIRLLYELTTRRSPTKPKYAAIVTKKIGLISYFETNQSTQTADGVDRIWFHYPQRISRYFIGINERLEKLLSEYCIDQITDLKSGIVIDVGSNVGEFSLALSKRVPENLYVRFEPSLTENMASLINTSGIDSILIPRALWSSEKELEFFQANESGDSSIFPANRNAKCSKILATTLDIELSKMNLKQIELIKLEAEGAEPEILLGATETLKITRYVSADLGPERGIAQETTFEGANRILIQQGFTLIGRNKGERQCYLYRNSTII